MLLSAMSVLVVALSSSEIPEGLMNNSVFLTVWSIKLYKYFFVLQTWSSTSLNLLEAIVEITRDAKCRDAYCTRFTESMICAGTTSGGRGPCYVRGL